MNKALKIIGLLTMIFIGQISNGQTNKEQALEKAREGIRLEDEEGKFDEAIKLFGEAQKLDSENINYPYELAYAFISKKEYDEAASILEKLLNHKDIHAKVYQALGNVYDYQGNPRKAIAIYEKGIKQFPNSGEIYLELGNMRLIEKDYNEALSYYEKGIEVDPKFPSNYYWASKIYCSSDEEVWGMIYGEIFMNLERNSKRTAEISKLLFDTYKSEIKFTSDTSFGVSFSKSATINVNDSKGSKKFKLPFGTGAYGMTLSMAVIGETAIDINSLSNIRTRFIELYFKSDNAKNYPNILFDYQQKVINAGHFEAYNHWILMKGDENGFEKWHSENTKKWDDFVNWFSDNQLQLNLSHRFYRTQY
jgi:tetratricopeptide (TPR) repeat protein